MPLQRAQGNVHTAANSQRAEEIKFFISYVWIKVLATCEGAIRDSVPPPFLNV